MSTSVSFLLEAHLVSGRILPQGWRRKRVAKHRKHNRGEDRSYPPPLSLSRPTHLSFLWVAWTNLGPVTSTPPIYSLGRVDQPQPSRPLHLSILWVAWTNLSPHVHSTCLFFGSRGPTSPIQVCVPDMSVLSTRVWVQQAACKGCKGKRGPPGPSCSHPENPSSSRQKRVF